MMRVIILLFSLLVFNINASNSIRDNKITDYDLQNIELRGQYTIVNDDLEAVFQLPSKAPRGVVFLAHGCSHSATDWWPKSVTCPQCIGLPVESSIVRHALSRQYAVVALSSYNRIHKCWGGIDVSRAIRLIQYFYDSYLSKQFPSLSSNSIPLYLMGGSSGGNFVGILSQNIHQSLPQITVGSVCIQISSIHVVNPKLLPPTLFVLMTKDSFTMKHVQDIVNHVPKTKILEVSEQSISPTFFYEHSFGNITRTESHLIHATLLKHKFIDSSFMLTEDPRESSWREVIDCAIYLLLFYQDHC